MRGTSGDPRPPRKDEQGSAPRGGAMQARGAAPGRGRENKAPPPPFDAQEITNFLTSRYNAAFEEEKKLRTNADKQKSAGPGGRAGAQSPPPISVYQAEGSVWGQNTKAIIPGTDDFLSDLQKALQGFEREKTTPPHSQ